MAEPHSALGMILPAAYQPPLPVDQLLVPVGASGAGDRMELDVLIVGEGSAAVPELVRLLREEAKVL